MEDKIIKTIKENVDQAYSAALPWRCSGIITGPARDGMSAAKLPDSYFKDFEITQNTGEDKGDV